MSLEIFIAGLVALNAKHAAEEKAGTVRYSWPEYQNPAAGKASESGEG